jgi:type IV pilus assembly protein PilC
MAIRPDEGGTPAAPKRRTRRTTTTLAEHLGDDAGAPEITVVPRNAETSAARSLPTSWVSGGIRNGDITNFLRQLIMLLEAGTPLLRSLRSIGKRGENSAVRALVGDIALFVEAGNPLWQAFDRHPRYFDSVFVNLIKASEASGTLTTVLRRTVDYRQSRELLGKRVRGAMVYPVLLVLACLGVMLLLTNLVVPQFVEIFERANMEVPRVTQIFLNAVDVFNAWWWLPVVIVVALVLVYLLWFVRSPRRRLLADYIKLRIPVIGNIIHKNALVEMMRTFSLLLRSGLSMMSTLDLTRNAIHNSAVAQVLQQLRDHIEAGGSMEEPLRANRKVIPDVVTDMLVTGEEAGRVDAITEQIADVYEEEVEIAVATLGEALQPVFTLVIGIIVVILFGALFLPIIGMIQQIGNAAG